MIKEDIIRVELDTSGYDICVGQGLISSLGELIKERFGKRRIFVVTDDQVASHWLTPVSAALSSAGLKIEITKLSPGEGAKSFGQLEVLIDGFLDSQIGRDSLIIALGGGVIGDLTGFAAAITLRGIDIVQLPTTLLSQVDSSVGGKTAINARQGKNLVGSFYQPSLVVIDTDVLETLSRRQLLAGYAEIVKYGFIKDRSFFEWLESNGKKILIGDAEAQKFAILRSCQIKAQIVESDEKEKDQRALLNFGHTFGHALEAEAGYNDELLHGEAVSMGMIMALELSKSMGCLSGQEAVRARNHMVRVGLPINASTVKGSESWQTSKLIEHMWHDKKVLNGRMRFVLTEKIGGAFVTSDVNEEDVYDVVKKSLAGDL